MNFVIHDGQRCWYRDDCECGLVCKITMPGEGKIVYSCDNFRKNNNECRRITSDKQKRNENR